MARAFNAIRTLVLGGAGIGAFYAAAHLSGRHAADDGIVEAARTPAAAASARSAAASAALATSNAPSERVAAAPAAALSVDELRTARAEAIPRESGDLFAAMSWLPPAPPPRPVAVVVAAPAAPTAPPLPFTFVGMVEQGTPQPQAFLSKGDSLLIVSAGDVIDSGSYRVDSLSPSQVVLVHLPTRTRQIINVSGSAP